MCRTVGIMGVKKAKIFSNRFNVKENKGKIIDIINIRSTLSRMHFFLLSHPLILNDFN